MAILRASTEVQDAQDAYNDLVNTGIEKELKAKGYDAQIDWSRPEGYVLTISKGGKTVRFFEVDHEDSDLGFKKSNFKRYYEDDANGTYTLNGAILTTPKFSFEFAIDASEVINGFNNFVTSMIERTAELTLKRTTAVNKQELTAMLKKQGIKVVGNKVKISDLKKVLAKVATAESKPSVYVGTYAKYGNGSIKGKWLNLEDYADKDAFYEAAKELHKDEEDPELMFQDFEGFPKRYYGESSISESLWDWMDLNADDRELLEIYIDEVNDEDATIDQAREAFMGKYDSEQAWAQEFVDDVGLSKDQLNYYLTLSDTDAEMIASEEADSLYDDREDDEILEEADMAEEYEAEEDEGKKDAILEKAKEKVKEAYSDEVEAKLKKDPVGYFVDDLGAYSIEDLAKANFMSIDYEAYARDARLGGDVSFVRKYGETWVFSNNV